MARNFMKTSLVAATFAAAALFAQGANAQSAMSSRRADVTVQRQCVQAVERRLPGSDTSTNLEYNKNAMYFACVHNGGQIPGSAIQ
jgi:hypothetical protein